MKDKDMIKSLEEQGYKIERPDVKYKLEVIYNDFMSDSFVVEIEAPAGSTQEELLDILIWDYSEKLEDALELDDVVEVGRDYWRIYFTLASNPNKKTFYKIEAYSEEDAIDIAYEMSLDDFEIISYEFINEA